MPLWNLVQSSRQSIQPYPNELPPTTGNVIARTSPVSGNRTGTSVSSSSTTTVVDVVVLDDVVVVLVLVEVVLGDDDVVVVLDDDVVVVLDVVGVVVLDVDGVGVLEVVVLGSVVVGAGCGSVDVGAAGSSPTGATVVVGAAVGAVAVDGGGGCTVGDVVDGAAADCAAGAAWSQSDDTTMVATSTSPTTPTTRPLSDAVTPPRRDDPERPWPEGARPRPFPPTNLHRASSA